MKSLTALKANYILLSSVHLHTSYIRVRRKIILISPAASASESILLNLRFILTPNRGNSPEYTGKL